MIDNQDVNRLIFENMRATTALVAILKHHGKMSVPKEIFNELVTVKQEFPNDFITKNGSMMCVTHNEEDDSIGFELRYKSDGEFPKNTIGFHCTRGNPEVGFVDYNSPHYRE